MTQTSHCLRVVFLEGSRLIFNWSLFIEKSFENPLVFVRNNMCTFWIKFFGKGGYINTIHHTMLISVVTSESDLIYRLLLLWQQMWKGTVLFQLVIFPNTKICSSVVCLFSHCMMPLTLRCTTSALHPYPSWPTVYWNSTSTLTLWPQIPDCICK